MGFLDNIRSIFSNARKSASKKNYDNLQEGKRVNFSPESVRYSYEDQEDTSANRDWKPQTKEEKKSLSPENYFRIGERAGRKNDLIKGIFDSAKEQIKAEHKRYGEKRLNSEAEKQSNDIFNSQYNEKQIQIPSTAIKKIKYNPQNEGLTVKFQGGKKNYFYPSVPVEVIKAWLKSPSKGEYFMKNIHDQYSMFGKDHGRKTRAEQKSVRHIQRMFNRKTQNANAELGRFRAAVKNSGKEA